MVGTNRLFISDMITSLALRQSTSFLVSVKQTWRMLLDLQEPITNRDVTIVQQSTIKPMCISHAISLLRWINKRWLAKYVSSTIARHAISNVKQMNQGRQVWGQMVDRKQPCSKFGSKFIMKWYHNHSLLNVSLSTRQLGTDLNTFSWIYSAFPVWIWWQWFS